MDLLILLKALILGVVEGLTEFLPISSTGHLILAGSLLNFNDEKGKVFEVVIQLAAILAVCWEYRVKLINVSKGLTHDPQSQRFVVNVLVAFLPAAVLGFLFVKAIKMYLFNAICVATAFIVGGFIILWAERRAPRHARVQSIDDMSALDAFKVGVAQCFAMIPGTSRSGATIIGGMLFGLSRRTAAEFSFFLAIPTMFAATVYDVYKHWNLFALSDLPVFVVGSVASFLSAFFAVRALLRFISNHTFEVFAWYRIAFGVVILLTHYFGIVSWAN
ncbi:undecaprenyl-diphosphatase [Chitinivorax tropicus]|uniref:Undecaprenyl-diphosphatase n=1 Tax=Chitinivorax tropicus TaxID=714531 RepID=A0A840MR76_9PROT|nr:undecaprenyl-diphosphate phosphatase [Chitinivorax tropicus]MBB5019935.1 undecaprenyl-diphosphatase [Chitinivorax tropicus]